jgi:hypothetical protein
MTQRLRLMLMLTAVIYTIWIAFTFTVGQVTSGVEIAANLFIGLIFGLLSTFMADHDAPRLYLRDLLVHLLFFASMGLLFAAFTLRGNFVFGYIDFFGDVVLDRAGLLGYLWHFTWRGALLGVGLWVLTLIGTGTLIGDIRGPVLTIGVALIALFTAPLFADGLYNGTIFLIVAVGTRVVMSLLVGRLSLWWRGFLFGTAAGMTMVMLPFLGYYGYGVI